MTPSTDLTTTPGSELTTEQIEQIEQQAAQEKREQLQDERVGVPILSIVQGTTKNPPEGSKPGDLVNALTGDNFGTDIDFLVVTYHRGRFYAETDEKGKRTGRSFAAGSDTVVPRFWPDKFAGKVFAELPEAEERYAEMANDGAIEWGSGPPIQTTYNFTGYILRPELENAEPFPVRFPLKATSAKAAKAIYRALAPLRNYWQRSVHVSTDREVGSEGPYYVAKFEGFGPAPSDAQRRSALELYALSQQVGVKELGEDPEVQSDPDTPDEEAPAEKPAGDGPNF